MHFAFFLDQFPVLSETFILNQIHHLKKLPNTKITVIRVSKGQDISAHKTYTNITEGIELITLYNGSDSKTNRLLALPSALFKAPGLLKLLLKPAFRGLSITQMIKGFPQQLPEFDCIYTHFGHVGVFAEALQELGLLRGPIKTFFHGNDLSDHNLWAKFSSSYPRLSQSPNVSLPISNFWKEKLLSIGCDPENTSVHRMGIDPFLFDFSPKEGVNSPLKISSVARLTEKKGLLFALRSMKILKEQGVKFTYNILGDGPALESLKKECSDLGLDDVVSLKGRVGTEDVKSELSSSDLFLLPSVVANSGDMEGIPVALMEAMSKGLLVLSTYHSGIPELIENEKTGFLVEEKNPDAIAESIKKLMNLAPKSRLEILNNARQKVESEFNIHKLNDQLSQL